MSLDIHCSSACGSLMAGPGPFWGLHVLVNADGYVKLTNMLFSDDDPHFDTDPVFGVKFALVRPSPKRAGVLAPDGNAVEGEVYTIEYDFVLATEQKAAA
jgi:hypothetical protein